MFRRLLVFLGILPKPKPAPKPDCRVFQSKPDYKPDYKPAGEPIVATIKPPKPERLFGAGDPALTTLTKVKNAITSDSIVANQAETPKPKRKRSTTRKKSKAEVADPLGR